MSRGGLLCVLAMCVLLWAAGSTRACAEWQNGGSLTGRIMDGAGAPVAHARLAITEAGTGTTYELHTDAQGRFVLPEVAPGEYTVEVEAAGFAPWTEGGVEVNADAQVVLAPKLALAARAHAASPQGNPRQWMEADKALARLKREDDGVLVTERPAAQVQIAEVKRRDTSELTSAAFRPTLRQQRAKYGAPDGTGDEIASVPARVHARVTVTTARGVVTASIAEVPIKVTQRGDWAVFEPGDAAGQRVSELAIPSHSSQRQAGMGHHESANHALPIVGAAEKAQVQGKAAKLQELAEAFVPAQRNVTDTETNFTAATNRETEGDDSGNLREVSSQIESGQSGGGQRRSRDSIADADADALTASGVRSKDGRLHGEAFVEDRDKAWGSQNAFTTLTTETSDGSFVTTPYHPPDLRMQYGLELGGAVAKGRGQWSVAVDELTRNFPGMAVPSDPEKFFDSKLSASQLATLTARLGTVGTASLSSSGVAQQEYTQAMGDLTALLGPVARRTRQTIALPRFSWKINDRNRISVGYDLVRLNAKNGMETAPTATWGIGSFGTKTLKVDAVAAGLNTFVTPNLLNELRYAHIHNLESEMADSPTAFEEQFAKNYFGAPPEVSVASGSGGFKFGTPSTLNRPAYPDELRQEAGEMLEWAHGRNQMDAGYQLDYVRDRTSGLTYATGDYTYSTKEAFVADLLAPDHCDASSSGAGSLPCWSTFRQMTGPTDFRFNTAEYAGFVTDTLKLWRSLTVAVGARYDYQKLPKANAAMANPDIPQTAALPSEGNLSPRVGFAWEPPWSRGQARWTTVLRGGFGVFYGRIPNATVLAALTQTGTADAQRIYLFKPLDVGAPTFPYVFSPNPDVTVEPDVTYFATGFEHARAEQAEFSLGQSLGRHVQLSLNYQGSFGSHLPRIVDQNIDLTNVGQITYAVTDPEHLGPLPVTYTSKFYYQRLNPKYQQMAAMESTANSRYQAVGASMVARLPRGMALTLDYRYAHAVDDNPYAEAYHGRWDVLDPADMALEHGTSNEDIRDRLRGGLVLHEPWHVKKGWAADVADGYMVEMTGGVQSGKPYTMRVSSTVPSMGCSQYEGLLEGKNCVLIPLQGAISNPYSVSGLGSGIDGAGGGNWLPTVGRNTFRYPGTYNANLRVGKKIALPGRASLMFQADVSNVLNHRNVTNIEKMGYSLAGVKTQTLTGDLRYLDGDNGQAQFGTVTDTNSTRTYTDRQIELIMRLIF